MPATHFVFDDSSDAVRAARALQRQGVDPLSIGIHRWDARFCVRIRSDLPETLQRTVVELGGRLYERVEESEAAVAPSPLTRGGRLRPAAHERPS